jgi:hypothetical protein
MNKDHYENRAFAVRFGRTAKNKKCTTKILPCVFPGNARQKPHDTFLHGNAPLPYAFYRHVRQPFAAR